MLFTMNSTMNTAGVDALDLEYRISRMESVATAWGLDLIQPLIAEYKIPEDLLEEFESLLQIYVLRCLTGKFSRRVFKNFDEIDVDTLRACRTNVTPNGALVPKTEYQLMYNLLLMKWFEVYKSMISKNPNFVKLVRVTPNIRLKFGRELEDNKNRGLNTEYPHSDAWVEGPWGYNVFVPMLGDCLNNTLRYYKIPKAGLSKNFFDQSKTYTTKQDLVAGFLEITDFIPKKGHIYISDYAVVHKTWRSQKSKARVSIDTTLMVGDHPVHPDREVEYLNKVPTLGVDSLFKVAVREKNSLVPAKKTDFSHYTTGNINLINI